MYYRIFLSVSLTKIIEIAKNLFIMDPGHTHTVHLLFSQPLLVIKAFAEDMCGVFVR